MIAAVLAAALALTAIGQVLAIVYLMRMNSNEQSAYLHERRYLISAMLQAQGKSDAALKITAPTPDETLRQTEAMAALEQEIREGAGVFSAENPFGRTEPRKPLGV